MIVFENVSKIYEPDVVGLQDFTWHIPKGEFVFLVGPSGSGKSTLIKLVLKELEPDRGPHPGGRPQPLYAAAQQGAVPAPQHRLRVPGLQAAAQQDRLRERRLRARGGRRAPAQHPPQGARDPQPRGPGRQDEQPARTRSAAASSSASPSPALSSTTRRCCSPTSRPATSTPRRRSASCSCSCASTAPARQWWWPRTTATWSTACAGACSSSRAAAWCATSSAAATTRSPTRR